jgi:adenylate cyclase class 2
VEPLETEVKLRLGDVETVRASLRRAGAVLACERHLEDNVLFDDRSASLRAQGTVLRLRRTPLGGLLTFKGPRTVEGGIKSREERETAVAQPDALATILMRLGYQPVFRYQKYRESWRHLGQQVEVDETPIGAFLEIEGDTEGIHAVAAQLGFSPRDYVSESYVALFFAAGGRGDMLFPPPAA